MMSNHVNEWPNHSVRWWVRCGREGVKRIHWDSFVLLGSESLEAHGPLVLARESESLLQYE